MFFVDRIKPDVGLPDGLCHGCASTDTGTRAGASTATGTDTCCNACANPGTCCSSANYPAASGSCAAQRVGCASGTD